MASLFFSTTAGTFLLEPLKILLISLMLSCFLRSSVHNELSQMSPVARDYCHVIHNKSFAAFEPQLPEDVSEQSNEEIEKKRTEHQLQQRLNSVVRGVTVQVLVLFVIVLIASHASVKESFEQNSIIKTRLGIAQAEEVVNRIDHIYTWLVTTFLPLAMPKFWYNGDLMSVYNQRFTSEQAFYRFTRISLTQSRVKPNCTVHKTILESLNVPLVCYYEYDSDNLETRSFVQDWVACDNSSCLVAGFTYVPGDERSLPIDGSDKSYDPGGYQVLLEQEQHRAVSLIQTLQTSGWVDQLTRAVVLEFSVFNADTRLFTQTKVLFETPTFGSVLVRTEVKSARLYPYTDAWDYMILFFQIMFAVMILVRIGQLIHLLTCPKGRERLKAATVLECLDLTVSVVAVTIYSIRIDQTIDLVEFIRNSPGSFASLDKVIALNEGYNLCISIVLFIRILRFLGPLAVNYYLYIMHVSLVTMRGFLFSLLGTVLLVLVAFSCFFYILEGPVTHSVRTVPSAMTTLLTLLLGMTKYKSFRSSVTGFVQFQMHRGMYCLFGTVCTLILLNIAISMLNASLSVIKNKETKLEKLLKKRRGRSGVSGEEETAWTEGVRDDLDRQLGSFVWNKFLSLFYATTKSEEEQTASESKNKPAKSAMSHQQFNSKFQSMITRLTAWDSSVPTIPSIAQDRKKSSFLHYWNTVVKQRNGSDETTKERPEMWK